MAKRAETRKAKAQAAAVLCAQMERNNLERNKLFPRAECALFADCNR